MRNVYTIPENERENVLKLLTRYSKKTAAYGQPLSYEMGEPYATEIKVYKTGYGKCTDHHHSAVQACSERYADKSKRTFHQYGDEAVFVNRCV